MITEGSRIAIVGAGAWGLSTALHLIREGYTNVTVFERAERIPSRYSAACDLNKIVRAEYEDKFYSALALEAIEGWKSPLFGPYYHQTGYIVAATGKAPVKATEHLGKALATIETDPVFAPGIRRLNYPQDFKDCLWQFSGPLRGFKGYYNRLAGYSHSSDAMKGIWEYCSANSVRFFLGEKEGAVTSLVSSEDNRCVGVSTSNGKFHPADLVVCAAGAYTASLITDVGSFTTARCWSVAHVQLNEEETNFLRGIPTTNIRDLGFFFEPDPKTRLFKLCPLGTGYTNTVTNTGNDSGISLPPSSGQPWLKDYIPHEDEMKLRQLLRETFPWMAQKPFVEKKMCWFSDTRDSNFCIDYVPGTQKSVVCLAGDSGHGFKMMPIFGKWVVALLHAGRQDEQRWQWPTSQSDGKDWGGSVSWRVGTGGELHDVVDAELRTSRSVH